MKIYQLEYFIEVYKCNSVSKAADNLYVSQPTISFALKELKDEFGVNLFTRSGNGIIPTVEGKIFYAKAVNILNSIRALKQDMLSLGGKTTHLKVGTPPMIGTILFPEMYQDLRNQLPKIELEILEYGSLRVRDLVQKNEADIAIAILDDKMDDSLESYKLFSTELVFCVDKKHHLSKKGTINWSDLDKENIILMKEDSFQNTMVKQRLEQTSIIPNIVLYSSQLTTITKFIHSGMAGAFLFSSLCVDDSFVPLHLADPIMLDIGAIWRKNSQDFLNSTKFMTFLKRYVDERFNG
ncbi:MAG: LysR family transcriptional regulator [Clostridia bacterium]